MRNTVIGKANIKLQYFEEAFTSQHWLMRIYKWVRSGSSLGAVVTSGICSLPCAWLLCACRVKDAPMRQPSKTAKNVKLVVPK